MKYEPWFWNTLLATNYSKINNYWNMPIYLTHNHNNYWLIKFDGEILGSYLFYVHTYHSTMAWSLQKMILSFWDFKLKWCFKVPKKPIFYEIKAFLHVEYSKEEKKLIQKLFALYLSVKIAQKIDGF